MNAQPCDTLVLFGVTGDLAAKMVLPAADRLMRERDIRLIGVAREGDDDALRDRIRDNLDRAGALDKSAADALSRRIAFVTGPLDDAATYERLRSTLAKRCRPLFYLAIPPALFAGVALALARAGLADGAKIAVEKPFGHTLASAQALETTLADAFAPDSILRVDHYLAKASVRSLVDRRADDPRLEGAWNREHVTSVQITMAETFGVETRGAFFDRVGALRDVVQNHLLQVVAILAMELPQAGDAASWQDARVGALETLAPLTPADIVRGQYDGYRDIDGVAADSQTETFIALRLRIGAPRWQGVPFCVRAGKRLPLTTTEVFARFANREPLRHVRFRLGPGPVDMGVARSGDEGEQRTDLGREDDRDAYATLLAAAMRGDPAYFERAAGVMASWRAVDAVLGPIAPVHPYRPGSWGPREADRILAQGDRWHDPTPRE